MASGLMVFGLMIVVLGFGFYVAFMRVPRCADAAFLSNLWPKEHVR
jgi:hypothetical protein